MNILITGGGTGGHLYPGLIMAQSLAADNNVYYIASKNGVDKDIIEKEKKKLSKIKIEYWDLRGLQRKITIKNIVINLINIVKLINCNLKAKKFLKKNQIDIVIGVGGYISYPLVKGASKKNIPTLIHEQNSYPGLVNRKLGKIVDRVGIVYNSVREYFPKEKVINVSNPRVNETMKYIHNDYTEELNLDFKKKKILFLGGSLGADTINNLFVIFAKDSSFFSKQYQAILVSGLLNNNDYNQLKKYENQGHKVIEYTSELLKYIATADIIISRGGATTLLEIIYLEKKSLIIPSPNVVGNHQLMNAKEFAKQDLLEYIEEKNLNNNIFIDKLKVLSKNEEMEKKLQKYHKIDSLGEIKKIVKDLYENRKNY